jgi:ABC-type lipoprotein export system ATPase subunit
MGMINVNKITKKYGDFYALSELSLNFDAAEQYAILGASGSGKSSLLYLMGGLDRPDSGDIIIDQESLFSMNDKEMALFRNRYVGFVFQFHFLLPSIDCMQNILLPAQIGGVKDKEVKKRSMELADHLGVSHCLKKYPYQLSGGEQQRISIIRALSLKPKMLLCDEPTGSLDSENSQKVTTLLKELANEFSSTLVIVTHDPSVAQHFDKQCRLKDGRLIN